MRRIREDFLKQEVIKHLNHWFSNFRETSDSLGLRLAKNFHFERVQHMIIMQRFSEYSLKNIYLSHIVVPFPKLLIWCEGIFFNRKEKTFLINSKDWSISMYKQGEKSWRLLFKYWQKTKHSSKCFYSFNSYNKNLIK